MIAATIASAIIAGLALILAGIALRHSKTANTHADEANTLAAKANTLAEQAHRDAKNAPAEQALRDLYRKIDHAFTTVAITTTGNHDDDRPIGPLPDEFDNTLAELRRLRDLMPATSLHHGLAGTLGQLDHARTCWQDLHNAQNARRRLDADLEAREHVDHRGYGDTLSEFHKTIEREQKKMLRSRDIIKEEVKEVTPELRTLIYGTQT